MKLVNNTIETSKARKIIGLIYIISAILFACYSSIVQIHPALFWINLLAPNVGDEYSIVLVAGLTIIELLLPLIIFSKLFEYIKKNSKAKSSIPK